MMNWVEENHSSDDNRAKRSNKLLRSDGGQVELATEPSQQTDSWKYTATSPHVSEYYHLRGKVTSASTTLMYEPISLDDFVSEWAVPVYTYHFSTNVMDEYMEGPGGDWNRLAEPLQAPVLEAQRTRIRFLESKAPEFVFKREPDYVAQFKPESEKSEMMQITDRTLGYLVTTTENAISELPGIGELLLLKDQLAASYNYLADVNEILEDDVDDITEPFWFKYKNEGPFPNGRKSCATFVRFFLLLDPGETVEFDVLHDSNYTGTGKRFRLENTVEITAPENIPDQPEPPNPEFTYPSSPPAGKKITFDASGSRSSESRIEYYLWEVEMGEEQLASGTGKTFSVSFPRKGTYYVNLSVVDARGVSAGIRKSVPVGESEDGDDRRGDDGERGDDRRGDDDERGDDRRGDDGGHDNTPPKARFSVDHPSSIPSPGESLTFDASNSNDPDGTVVSYEWEFFEKPTRNRIDTASGKRVTNSFEAGTYGVILKITDDGGATASTSRTVHVRDLQNTLVIDGTSEGRGTRYEFSVSGALEQIEGTVAEHRVTRNESDRVSGSDASGWVGRFADGFRYSGELTNLALDYPEEATVFINGEPRDPGTIPRGNESPEATFTTTPSSPSAGEAVTFDARGSEDPDGTITSYRWTFTDSETGERVDVMSGERVTRSFSGGEYEILLRVTDDDGATGSISQNLTVANEPPSARFDASPATPTATEEVTFDASQSGDPDGSTLEYVWRIYRMEDGNIGTEPVTIRSGQTITHVFTDPITYWVELRVTDEGGASDKTSQLVDVNAPPKVAFKIRPDSPEPGESVTFDARESSDPDGTITSYNWEIKHDSDQDLETDTGETVTRTFSGGQYTVTLSVTDDSGVTVTSSKPLDINRPPEARFDVSPASPSVDEGVTFDASRSADPDGTIVNYRWKIYRMESGIIEPEPIATLNGPTVTYRFPEPVTYTIELMVKDDNGATDTTSDLVDVTAHPEATFVINPSSPHSNELVTFDASESKSPDSSIEKYEWEFQKKDSKDSDTKSGVTVRREFVSGVYDVSLIVADEAGNTDSTTKPLEVSPPPERPVARFDTTPNAPDAGEPTSFDASASSDPDGSITRYEWAIYRMEAGEIDPEPITTRSGQTIEYSFTDPVTYNVELTVTDDSGKTDSTSQLVSVSASS